MRRVWRVLFLLIAASGLVATMIRFTRGLGATTNMSDSFPWGLWVGFDVLVGVGLSAGGFIIAATVTIFQIERYKSLSRPAILTAFLGYLLVIFALLFDLGRPYRIWHPLVMGNPHSVMFEVAMCVMLYTIVLALEFSPAVFKRFGFNAPVRVIHSIYVPIVLAGVLLSTLHQSSLGTLYVIVPDKLHPLWYTPLLPVFFFLSAIAGGLSMVIFESFMSFRAFAKRLEQDLLDGIARVIVVVLAVFLVWKFLNLEERGALGLAFQATPESVMFWGEMSLGVILPMIMFMLPQIRKSQAGLFFAATLTVMGFIINRLNVAITGMVGSSGVNYIPSWMEFAVTTTIVALGFALFGLAVKHLDVFPSQSEASAPPPPCGARLRPAFPGRAIAGLWALLLIGFVLFGFTVRTQSSEETAMFATDVVGNDVEPTTKVSARYSAPEVILPGEITLPMGEDSPGSVIFDHDTHVDLDANGCGRCHAGMFPILPATPRKPMMMDRLDQGHFCGECHNGDDAFDTEEDCESCHAM